MKTYRFDNEIGREIDEFGSQKVTLSRIAHLDSEATISCMHLAPEGVIGLHQAAAPQLFLVVEGSGWVRGQSPERLPITPGRAAFWEKGEWHESGTEEGMTAIVIESDVLDPAQFMPEA